MRTCSGESSRGLIPPATWFFRSRRSSGRGPSTGASSGIDATWKKGYPLPLEMDESIVKLVDSRWGEYWK